MAETVKESFIVQENLPYGFCPGCSHGKILEAFDASLQLQGLDPSDVVIVTDIGCVGLSDKYFSTHAFHGLHGRAITYGSGIKMANPDLNVVVFIGDGGCGIGGHHLLNAARLNTDVTTLVFNNFNFGMTGGQHSATTPFHSITATTPLGSTDVPMDIAGTAKVNGAGFVARCTAFDKDLPELIAKAMRHTGFSLLDIWELCTAYYVPRNNFSRKEMIALMDGMEMEAGILSETDRPSFQSSYKKIQEQSGSLKPISGKVLDSKFESSLDRPVRIVLAGSAGQKVVSAGDLIASAATLSGLWTARRADFPVTIQTGFSIAELVISPEPIDYFGIPKPDIAAVIAPEGKVKIEKLISKMDGLGKLYYSEGLEGFETSADIIRLEFPEDLKKLERKNIAAMTAAVISKDLDLFPFEALKEAVRQVQKSEIARINLDIFRYFE